MGHHVRRDESLFSVVVSIRIAGAIQQPAVERFFSEAVACFHENRFSFMTVHISDYVRNCVRPSLGPSVAELNLKQGRIHGYNCRLRAGRAHI